MEENKNLEQAQANGNGQSGGRKRRRKRHRGGGNSSAQNQQAQNQQNQQNQKNQQNQQPRQAQSPQQNANNNPQNGGKKKNKNRNDNKQGQGNKSEQSKNVESKQEENRKDTYLYTLDGNLYVNLTNKCSNGCDFCVRNERTSYYGNYLWLRHGDPTAEKVISAANGLGDLSRFKEVVFCGFGEPTYKVAEMVALCDYFHEKGLKTRLNTNGQGNLINKRDIVPELKGKIDFVNISLNASCVEKYQPICRSQFGEAGFAGLIEFAKLCRRNGVPCRFSIVDCIGEEEVEACKRLAQSVNIPLYIRDYITDS